jgi:hypothetical protein
LKSSRYDEITRTEIKLFYEDYVNRIFNLDNRRINNTLPEFPDTYLIVDSTEVLIEAYQKKSFSGKKKAFTVKYQLLVGAVTGEIMHLYGPELGSVHDAIIFRNSGIPQFLSQHGEYCLGIWSQLRSHLLIHQGTKDTLGAPE